MSDQARNFTVVMSSATIGLMLAHAITDDERWMVGALVALSFASVPVILHILGGRSGR